MSSYNSPINIYRKIVSLSKINMTKLIMWMILMFLLIIIDIAFALLIGLKSEIIITASGSMSSFDLILLSSLFLFKIALAAINVQIVSKFRENIALIFREKTMNSLLHSDYIWLKQQESGDILSKSGMNLTNSITFIANDLPELIILISQIIVSFIVVSIINWKVALLYFTSYPLILFIQIIFSKPAQVGFKEAFEEKGRYMGIVQNVFKNTFIIKIYEYFPNIQKWIEESFNIYASKYRRTWIIGIPGMIMAMILSLLPMTLLVIGCYFGVRDNFMQIGGLVAILIITSPLDNQLRTVFDTILRTRSRAESANRMMTLWEAPLESRKETAGVTLIEDKEPLLRLDNISFKYNNDYILDGLNITINKRDHIVIFGENGSGKSTLLNIIMNIYDIEKGAIYLKGINYMDIDKDIYRSKFSFVPQNNYIFSGPLVDNLKQGKNNATESEITYAIHEANLEGFISDLKEGLLTHTNEAGTCFSGGEKQRIAIARALIKDAEIVLLDEISSFLDDQTADSILNIINEKFADKTVIQISHDQNKIIKANRIITLVNGKAVEITN